MIGTAAGSEARPAHFRKSARFVGGAVGKSAPAGAAAMRRRFTPSLPSLPASVRAGAEDAVLDARG